MYGVDPGPNSGGPIRQPRRNPKAVVFLASDESSFTVGGELVIRRRDEYPVSAGGLVPDAGNDDFAPAEHSAVQGKRPGPQQGHSRRYGNQKGHG